MLTLKQCRALLGNSAGWSDAEIEQLREGLYGVAQMAISAAQRYQIPNTLKLPNQLWNLITSVGCRRFICYREIL
jgi:hypothetical protein